MLLTIVLLMTLGLAQDTPRQTATGTVPAGGGKVTFEIDKDDPQNPAGDRFTGERFEQALNVTLNSVVFRSSGQDLTTAGTYSEMTSRVTEPVLLGLAVLAVRNRVADRPALPVRGKPCERCDGPGPLAPGVSPIAIPSSSNPPTPPRAADDQSSPRLRG